MKFYHLLFLASIQLLAACSEKDPDSVLKGCCSNQPIDEDVGNGHIYVANIFTPNGDGHNDYMSISTKSIDLIVEVEVRNKQGEKVFESTTVQINIHASFAVFYIHQTDGRLTFVGHQSTYGDHPRNFTIDPTGKFLLVANMVTGNIVVLKRNLKTGLLTRTKNEIHVSFPSCLQMRTYGD